MTINPAWFAAAIPAAKLASQGIGRLASSIPFSLGSTAEPAAATTSGTEVGPTGAASNATVEKAGPELQLQQWLDRLHASMKKAGISSASSVSITTDGHGEVKVDSEDLEASQFVDEYLRNPDSKKELQDLVNGVRQAGSQPNASLGSSTYRDDRRQVMAMQIGMTGSRWDWYSEQA